MTLRPLHVTFRSPWTSHDAWSESYLGVSRLVYETLPTCIADTVAEDSALCQLALVGSNHLVELALVRILTAFADAGTAGLTPRCLARASQCQMLTEWLPKVTEKSLDLHAPPIASMRALQKRRNAATHRESALATVPMARSALFSAVEGCRHLFVHANAPFPWEDSLATRPVRNEVWFSTLVLPPDI